MDKITLHQWDTVPLADYLVALANTNGGILYLPAADSVVVQRILSPLLQAIRPTLVLNITAQPDRVVIEIPRSATVHALPDGRVMGWGNHGPLRLDGPQIRQLLAARAHDGFEQAPIPQTDFTVLDALCWATDAQTWLPHAIVEIHAYEGRHRYHQTTTQGTLLEQYQQALALLGELVTHHAGQRAIPLGVLAEMLLNALAHRDYRQKSPIVVAVHHGRIEMTIPGGLPGFATLSTLNSQHYHRNPKLVQYLVEQGAMQGVGNGWQILYTQLAQEGYTHPQVSLPNPYQMQIKVEHVAMTNGFALNWRQDRALTHIQQHGSLSLRTLRVLCADQQLENLQNDLAELVASGQLQAIGSGENAVYIHRV